MLGAAPTPLLDQGNPPKEASARRVYSGGAWLYATISTITTSGAALLGRISRFRQSIEPTPDMTHEEALAILGVLPGDDINKIQRTYEKTVADLQKRKLKVSPFFAGRIEESILKCQRAHDLLVGRE